MGLSQELNCVYPWKEAPEADYAVIGDPVSHSLSPRMHTAAYRALGLDLSYVAVEVKSGEVKQALDRLRSLGYKGVNVTVPHKEEVLDWVELCDEFAARVHSVNTVRLEDKFGFNTDAPGFLETIRLLTLQPGTPTMLLGAGGSARALAAVLSDEGYPLRIWNRTLSKVHHLIDEMDLDAAAWPTPDISGAGLVINATAASLSGERLPIDWNLAMPGLVAYDIMYGEKADLFLSEAGAVGARCFDGKSLLVMQGAFSFEFWTGKEAPHDAMWEAVN